MKNKIPTGLLQGRIQSPPSKSITHRLFIMGALSGKKCLIQKPLFCQDTEITLQGLKKLGFEFEVLPESVRFSGGRGAVDETNGGKVSTIEIDVGNSGTSARFLTALAALSPVECRIDGTPRMRQRPMAPLIKVLEQLGAEIDHNAGYLPLSIRGGKLSGGKVKIDSRLSSQFLSALLLIAPYLANDTTIHFGDSVVSKPYSEMTVDLMKRAGIRFSKADEVSESRNHYGIEAGQTYAVGKLEVEGDFSNAASFMVGAAISGGKIVMENLSRKSIQGDRIILEVLRNAGAHIQIRPTGMEITGGKLTGIDWDMRHYPDLVPAVAVMGLFARGNSRLRNVASLRLKESDRLQAIIDNVRKLDGKAHLVENDLVITPCRLTGAVLSSYNDHRIAMSFAMAGLRVPGVEVENAGCVVKSYPNFWNDFYRLIKQRDDP